MTKTSLLLLAAMLLCLTACAKAPEQKTYPDPKLVLVPTAEATPATPAPGDTLSQIKLMLLMATNRANLGADERGINQRGAMVGRMRSNTVRNQMQDGLIPWNEVDGVSVDNMGGSWQVLVGSKRLPMFHISLGYYQSEAQASQLADLVRQQAAAAR